MTSNSWRFVLRSFPVCDTEGWTALNMKLWSLEVGSWSLRCDHSAPMSHASKISSCNIGNREGGDGTSSRLSRTFGVLQYSTNTQLGQGHARLRVGIGSDTSILPPVLMLILTWTHSKGTCLKFDPNTSIIDTFWGDSGQKVTSDECVWGYWAAGIDVCMSQHVQD